MKLNQIALILPAAAMLALTVSAMPANAGQRGQRDDRRSSQQEGSRPSGSAQARQREARPAPPPAPAPQVQSQRAPQPQAPRAQGGSRVAPPRQSQAPQRPSQAPRVTPDRRDNASRSYDSNRSYGTNGSNGSYGPSRSYGSSGSYAVPRDYQRGGSPSYYSSGRYASRPVYRQYYSFRPRISLGFGIYLGYPVSFPTWYDPYVPGMYSAYRPGVSYGGVSFDIAPYDAAVYVDGQYVGVVEDFSATQPPLTLTAGRHHIDLESPGFQPMSFDLTVVPRQVIPYQGTLPRY